MKFLNIFISIILSLILIFSTIVFQVSISFKHDTSSKKLYLDKFDSSQIYDRYEKSIDSTFQEYAQKNNLPSTATENMISSQWIQDQFRIVLDGIIDFVLKKSNKLPTIDMNTPTNTFDSSLKSKLEERNIPVDKSVLNSEKDFYKSYDLIPFTENWNKIHGDDFKSDLKHYRKFIEYINICIYLSILSMVLCLVSLYYNTKNISKWKLWSGYSLILGGLITSLSCFLISNSNKVESYLNSHVSYPKESIIPPKTTTGMLADVVDKFIMNITKYSGIFVILGILIIVFISFFDSKKDNVFWYKHKPLSYK